MFKELIWKICSEDDTAKILEICRQSYLEHYSYLWTDNGENYIMTSFTRDKLMSEMKISGSSFYLIYDEESAVGVLKINKDKSPSGVKDADCLEIERIYFLKSAAGKGFGKLTLKLVGKLAAEENKKIIWLKAMKEGEAIKFYEKQGFVITDELDLSYPFIRDEFKRMVVMQMSVR